GGSRRRGRRRGPPGRRRSPHLRIRSPPGLLVSWRPFCEPFDSDALPNGARRVGTRRSRARGPGCRTPRMWDALGIHGWSPRWISRGAMMGSVSERDPRVLALLDGRDPIAVTDVEWARRLRISA